MYALLSLLYLVFTKLLYSVYFPFTPSDYIAQISTLNFRQPHRTLEICFYFHYLEMCLVAE
jgi:hypothetical protein